MSSVYFNADSELLGAAKKIAESKKTIYFGKMITGEQFIIDDMRAAINEKYSPLSVDMETASIAHTCYVNQIPFISIRTITDTATHSGVANFKQNCKQASIISKNIILDLLIKLPLTTTLGASL